MSCFHISSPGQRLVSGNSLAKPRTSCCHCPHGIRLSLSSKVGAPNSLKKWFRTGGEAVFVPKLVASALFVREAWGHHLSILKATH